MSAVTIALYVVAFGMWGYLVYREGRIGIGFRFMYALNLILFFLVGPMLGEVFGTTHKGFTARTFDTCVSLSLSAFLAYVAGSYLVYPWLLGRSRLIPPRFAARMAEPHRLDAQWKVGWALVWIGLASLPFYAVVRGIPTLGAIMSQLPWLVETGLVMLCLYAAYARRLRVFLPVLIVLLVKGIVFTALTGHAGFIFLNGIVLTSVAFLSARIRLSTLVALGLLGIVAFIPAQLWLKGRNQLRTAIRQGSGLEERIAITLDIFSNIGAWSESNEGAVVAYRDRGDYSDLMAAALAHTPAIQPYAYGQTYLEVFVAVIPRFLWPEKPFVAGGNEFVSKYTGISFDKNTSVGMHHMFELYVNFGPFGVVIGMFVIGLLLGWMESLYYRKGLNNLFYEACLILCSWSVCIYCDQTPVLAMTLPPAIVLCLLICTALWFQIHSRYLPSLFWRSEKSVPPTFRPQ